MLASNVRRFSLKLVTGRDTFRYTMGISLMLVSFARRVSLILVT